MDDTRFAMLALLGLIGCGRDDPAPKPGGTAPATDPAPFARVFVDVTAEVGIAFTHATGATGEKLYPECLGAGAAWFDRDADGDPDLFLVNGRSWDGARSGETSALFVNTEGRFERAGPEVGADLARYGMGASAADIDGDGDTDLYVTAVEENALLVNEGPRFRELAVERGVAGGTWTDAKGAEHPEWSTAAAWLDVDRDGDLDLFLANYVQWTPETDIFTTLDGRTKAFATPDRYAGLPCRLFRNGGDGHFAEDQGAGLGTPGKALGLAVWDLNEDGWLDVAVANDTRPNFLYLADGEGGFVERGSELGLAYDEAGRARAGMGVDIAVYANDGVPGIAIGNFGGEPMSLYRRAEGGAFRSVAAASGLAPATTPPLAFGLGFFDLDLDGRLDLVVANGHIEPEIGRFRAGETWAQRPQLFQGLAGGRFRNVSDEVGEAFAVPRSGRGLAAADFDGDGDLDLLLTQNGGRPVLFENRLAKDGTRPPRSVAIRAGGAHALPVGTRVTVDGPSGEQVRLVRTGSSYLSHSDSQLVFGLGAVRDPVGVLIELPNGERITSEIDATASEFVVNLPE